MSPRISVLTPAYNHGPFLAECVRSVLSQTFSDWEQIIVDDGSTDSTPEVATGFDDRRIRYFRRPHRGILRLGETYNFALAQARAPLIAVLEGDDFWRPEMLQTQAARLEDPGVVLAFAELAVAVQGRVQPAPPAARGWREAWRGNDPPGAALEPILCFQGMPQPATWLLRRTALEEIGGFRQPAGIATTDFPTLLALCLKGRFAYSDRVLACWRKHPAQATNVHSAAVFIGCADYAQSFYDRELPGEIKDRLGVSAEFLRSRIARQRAFGYFRQGRCELMAGRWPQARASFAKALAGGSPCVRAAALAGLGAAFLRTDLEPVARLMGKEWYGR